MLVFCAFSSVVLGQAFAQEGYGAANNWENTMSEWVLKENREGKGEAVSVPSVRNKYENHRGNPFYNDGVFHGSLVSARGDQVDNLLLLYDLFKNELYFLKDDREQLLIKPYLKEVHAIVKGETKVMRRVNPFELDRFYEVVFEDDQLVLFKDVEVNLIEGVNKGMIAVEPRFMKKTSHNLVVKKNSTEIVEVNLKKKDLLKMLPSDRAKACRNYLRENKKFRLKSEESYAEMLGATADLSNDQ